jgi:hypothetical protein
MKPGAGWLRCQPVTEVMSGRGKPMPGTLRLTRESEYLMELHRGTFEIVVDGQDAGPIERHETVERPLEPGQHTLQIREGRYKSRDSSFEVADGQVASFRCSGARIWPIYLASLIVPSLALTLKRE